MGERCKEEIASWESIPDLTTARCLPLLVLPERSRWEEICSLSFPFRVGDNGGEFFNFDFVGEIDLDCCFCVRGGNFG